ncbi:MAG: 30S ribosomal protein S6, partial [Candidatus Fimadaptatus sp.]
MNHYEAMYVIDAMVEEQPRKDLIERFSNLIVQNGGTVERIDEWGKRNLAYPINYKTI